MLDGGKDSDVESAIQSKFAAEYPPLGLANNVRTLPDWIQRGCGDSAYNCPEKNATFAVDGVTPNKMPDLSKHNNVMAEFLTKNPAVYDKLKNRKTASGVTLAHYIK